MIKQLVLPGLLFAQALWPGLAAGAESDHGTISGRLMHAGQAKVGLVAFYDTRTGPAPEPLQYFRIPDATTRSAADGSFKARLPAGNYCVTAVTRAKGSRLGPPDQGDLIFVWRGRSQRPRVFQLQPGKIVDVGIPGTPQLFGTLVPGTAPITAIEGTVRDGSGKPVKAVVVLAFQSWMLLGRPLYTSAPSDASGRFTLRVAGGGSYYLRARDGYGGGPPMAGAVVGAHGGDPPQPVVVASGETVSGKDIEVSAFKGRGPKKATSP